MGLQIKKKQRIQSLTSDFFEGGSEMDIYSNVTFNADGLMTLVETGYAEAALDEYKAAFYRLFYRSLYQTKEHALHRANILNGIISDDVELEKVKIYGMDKDIYMALSAIVSVIAICVITIWFICSLCSVLPIAG